jgi:hypothetical protein
MGTLVLSTQLEGMAANRLANEGTESNVRAHLCNRVSLPLQSRKLI